jgi:ribosomal protein S18 acetylase RimI-like enzyme
MESNIIIRAAKEEDRDFIFEQSPILAKVAELNWHTDEVVKKMQDDYISAMLSQTSVPHITLIAENNEVPLGFLHARSHKDGVSGETCGTVPLLSVSPEAQGMGVGKMLIEAAEVWAKGLGYRLLHLEVFANNSNAQNFYQKLGFEAETIQMIKNIG